MPLVQNEKEDSVEGDAAWLRIVTFDGHFHAVISYCPNIHSLF